MINEIFKRIEGEEVEQKIIVKEVEMIKYNNSKLDYEIMTMNLLSMVEVLYEKCEDIPLSQMELINTIKAIKHQKDIMITNQVMNEVYENKKKYILSNTEENKAVKKKRNNNENEKKYECDTCGCRFTKKFNLIRHKEITKKCGHIYVERIFTNATERVSDNDVENSIKNKNNILKNYDRTFIRSIVNIVKKQIRIYAMSDPEEAKKEYFIRKLEEIYRKKHEEYKKACIPKKQIKIMVKRDIYKK